MSRSNSHLLLLVLLGYCLDMTEGELRCYCNESGCVATGYMCKSTAGKCFTAVEIRGELTHLTHGCLDNLPEEQQRSCRVDMDVISTSKADWMTGHLPLLHCCTDHMCNYREDIDVSIVLTPKHNGTFHRGRAAVKEDSAIYSRNHHGSRDDDRDLWFKAAVIAVPIAGGFILVLLVLLAVRMLRSDSRPHRRLIQIRQEHSVTKAHMYISEHFSDKRSVKHCSLFKDKPNKNGASLYSDAAATKSNNRSSSNTRHSTNSGDATSNHCINSQHKDSTTKLDYGSGRGTNTSIVCHSSVPCSSACNTTSHITCSTNCDSHTKGTVHVDMCALCSQTSSKNASLPTNVSVRQNKGNQSFPHATKFISSRTCSGPVGHHHPFVFTWEKACPTGPAIV